MIQNILRHAGGIEGYGIFSILFFFTCFVGALWWALRLKKTFLDSMSQLPLESENSTTKNQS